MQPVYGWQMRRRSHLGPDPLATVTFSGLALVATAALLGSAGMDGPGVGFLDAIVAAFPLLIVAIYLLWVNAGRDADLEHQIAVSVLTAQADDPTIRGDDALSRAAADLIAALDDAEREAARRRLLRVLDGER
jgi:hypothetical protein